MSNLTLTIIVCGLFPIALVLGVAIIATHKRIKFANHLFEEIRMGNFGFLSTKTNKRRIRLFSILGMISAVGLIATTIMIITDILPLNSGPVIIAYFFLAFIGVFASVNLYKILTRESKDD
jgi:hypothetical protein